MMASLASAAEPFEVDSSTATTILKQCPRNASKVEWKQGKLQLLRFENPREFEDEALWGLMDWVGGEAGWMEIDPKGIVSAEMAGMISGAKQSWYRQSPGATSIVATLKGKVSATLEFRAVASSAKEVKQALDCRFQGSLDAFRDFDPANGEHCEPKDNAKCSMVHMEDSRLSAEVGKKSVSMVLRAPDAEPFPTIENFSLMSEGDQKQQVDDYRSYFKHEYTMAVRSFIESTPGLFNWQTWQWFSWGEDGLISRAEIKALLESGQRPGRLDVYKAACKDGRKVRIWSDGQGTMGMTLQ